MKYSIDGATKVDVQKSFSGKYSFLSNPERTGDLGQLGDYRLEEILGHGGMGVVFKGFDAKLSRQVAIKVMLPEVAQNNTLRDRFIREGRAMAAIKHDNIVSVYQVGEDAGIPYLIMEYLQGEAVDQFLRRKGPLPIPTCLELAQQMALGLAAAHEIGLIHRDIKPQNMWLEKKSNRIKLLDFGLAQRQEEDGGLTIDGTILGTPGFMSPEQAHGEKVDCRTDLFSLGCVFYVMATGHLPFDQRTISAVYKQSPAIPVAIRPDIPVALSSLVMQLLSQEPMERPKSAADVAETLLAIRSSELNCNLKRPEPEARIGLSKRTLGLPLRASIFIVSVVGIALLGVILAPWLCVSWSSTSMGTIVLEDVPPGAEVTVDGNVVEGTAGPGGVIGLEVAPGERELMVSANGFAPRTHTLTIASGEREIIRSSLRSLKERESELSEPVPHPGELVPEYMSLFNGKDLKTFHIDGNPSAIWKVKNGELFGFWEPDKSTEGGSQLIADRGGFRNYRLRLETMPPENWGCAIKILWNEEAHLRRMTPRRGWYSIGIGSLTNDQPFETAKISRADVEINPRRPVRLPPNAWATIEVEVIDTRIRVLVNGSLKNEYTLPSRRPNEGSVGLSLAGGASMRVRRFEIKELESR